MAAPGINDYAVKLEKEAYEEDNLGSMKND
jgi:hypothetical protein